MEANICKSQFQKIFELQNYEAFEKKIQRLYEKQMLPPVILLEGAKGTGKSIAAMKVSTMLLCESGGGSSSQSSPCGVCNSCLLIKLGQNPDHLYLDAAQVSGVDLVKQVQKFVEFGPERHVKIVNIVDCDALNTSAVNKLLKTLEEPSENIVFLLTSSRLNALLPTFRSRCVEWPAPFFSKQVTEEVVRSRSVADSESAEKRRKMIERFYSSPGSCLQALENEEITGIQELCEKVVRAKSIGELSQVSKWAGSYQKAAIYDLLNEFEYALNQSYKADGCNLSVMQIQERRKILRRVRRLVKTNQHLALNNTLFLEAIAAAQLPRG